MPGKAQHVIPPFLWQGDAIVSVGQTLPSATFPESAPTLL